MISSPAEYGTRNFEASALICATGTRKRLGDLREVVVDGDQRCTPFAREAHQGGVHIEHAGLLDELELHGRRLLQLDQHVETRGVLGRDDVGPRSR